MNGKGNKKANSLLTGQINYSNKSSNKPVASQIQISTKLKTERKQTITPDKPKQIPNQPVLKPVIDKGGLKILINPFFKNPK